MADAWRLPGEGTGSIDMREARTWALGFLVVLAAHLLLAAALTRTDGAPAGEPVQLPSFDVEMRWVESVGEAGADAETIASRAEPEEAASTADYEALDPAETDDATERPAEPVHPVLPEALEAERPVDLAAVAPETLEPAPAPDEATSAPTPPPLAAAEPTPLQLSQALPPTAVPPPAAAPSVATPADAGGPIPSEPLDPIAPLEAVPAGSRDTLEPRSAAPADARQPELPEPVTAESLESAVTETIETPRLPQPRSESAALAFRERAEAERRRAEAERRMAEVAPAEPRRERAESRERAEPRRDRAEPRRERAESRERAEPRRERAEPRRGAERRPAAAQAERRGRASRSAADGDDDRPPRQARGGTPGGARPQAEAGSGGASAASYQDRVFRHLQRHKRFPSGERRGGTVVVAFTVSASGGASGIRVRRSSGNPALDRAALDMVRRASPFPAIPAGLGRSTMSFSAPVNFSLR